MQALMTCSAGIDVHRNLIVCTVLRVDSESDGAKETRQFSAFPADLKKLAAWLKKSGVELAAMESTGIYWQAVYEAVEAVSIKVIVVNARHVKNVPGRKTDVKDSEWLAELAIHGLLRGSFIPERDLRELRMLTHYRFRLVSNLASEKNRLHKTLDSLGIKLGSVVSDIDGVSARKMLDELIDGTKGPMDIAKLGATHLRRKQDMVAGSLEVTLNDRHRFLLRQIRSHMKEIQGHIEEIDAQVLAAMKPYQKEWQLLQTVPGFDELSAAMLIAEIGTDMAQFGNKSRISSWAGMCSGNNESAGKKKAAAPQRVTATPNGCSARSPGPP